MHPPCVSKGREGREEGSKGIDEALLELMVEVLGKEEVLLAKVEEVLLAST